MLMKILYTIFMFKFALIWTKEAELPLCPTNVLYFPQNLPMHCRMPTSADFPAISGPFPTVPPFYQGLGPNKRPPIPIPMPMPPGVPAPPPMPSPMALPGPMPMSGPMIMPGPMPIPGPLGPMSFSGPMPLPPGPASKLPVIVMPFYSPDPSFKNSDKPNYSQHSLRPSMWKKRHKRRKPHIYSSPDTSSSTDMDTSDTSSIASSEYQGWWKGRRNHRRLKEPIRIKKKKRHQNRQLLTPVLQYVTKDGYVIFEKKITNNEAKDWLKIKNNEGVEFSTRVSPERRDTKSIEQNENRTGEREVITEDNVEVITQRNAPKLNKMKAHKNKATRNKFLQRPH